MHTTSVLLQDSRHPFLAEKEWSHRCFKGHCSSLRDTHELQLTDAFNKHVPVYVRRTLVAANLEH